MNTCEKLYILQRRFNEGYIDDLRIEAIESESEWGTTHYQFCVYVETSVVESIHKKHDRTKLKEYKNDGIVSCLDVDGVFVADTLYQAIGDLFEYCREGDLL